MSEDKNTAERLQKIIAQAGLASRREAEEWIRDGLVTVNGKTAKLGDKATLGSDAIKVKGKLLQTTEHKVYYLFYKPRNVIAMVNEDEEGRPTIKTYINRIKERVFTVGRMDFTGEGAILLTNDGAITQQILKSNTIIRRYQIKINKTPSTEDLERIARGGRIEGKSMHPLHVRLVNVYQKNALIELSFEGMNPLDLKKFIENKGFLAEKIARVGIGHLKADDLEPGTFKRIEATSIQALFKQPELAMKQITKLTEKRAKVMKVDGPNKRPAKSFSGRDVPVKETPYESPASRARREERTTARAERDARTERTSERAPSISGRKPPREKKTFGRDSRGPQARVTASRRSRSPTR